MEDVQRVGSEVLMVRRLCRNSGAWSLGVQAENHESLGSQIPSVLLENRGCSARRED